MVFLQIPSVLNYNVGCLRIINGLRWKSVLKIKSNFGENFVNYQTPNLGRIETLKPSFSWKL